MLHHRGAVHVPRRSTRRDARRVFWASRSIHRRQTAPTRRSAGRLDQSNIRHRHSSIDAHYVTQYSGTRSLDTFRVNFQPAGWVNFQPALTARILTCRRLREARDGSRHAPTVLRQKDAVREIAMFAASQLMPRVGYTTNCRRSLFSSFNRFPRRTLAGSFRHRVAPPEATSLTIRKVSKQWLYF